MNFRQWRKRQSKQTHEFGLDDIHGPRVYAYSNYIMPSGRLHVVYTAKPKVKKCERRKRFGCNNYRCYVTSVKQAMLGRDMELHHQPDGWIRLWHYWEDVPFCEVLTEYE